MLKVCCGAKPGVAAPGVLVLHCDQALSHDAVDANLDFTRLAHQLPVQVQVESVSILNGHAAFAAVLGDLGFDPRRPGGIFHRVDAGPVRHGPD